jgi:hypothetical protein
MIHSHYCRYYRLADSGQRIIVNDDEIVSGPKQLFDGSPDFEIRVASGMTFRVRDMFPEKVESEALPPTPSELRLNLRGYYFNRTFPVLESQEIEDAG